MIQLEDFTYAKVDRASFEEQLAETVVAAGNPEPATVRQILVDPNNAPCDEVLAPLREFAKRLNGQVPLGWLKRSDIDWSTLDQAALNQAFLAHAKDPEYRFESIALTSKSGAKYELRISKTSKEDEHTGSSEQFWFTLVNMDKEMPEIDGLAARFDLFHYPEESVDFWSIPHRKTLDEYKRQGIGEKILEIIEAMLAHKATLSKRAQIVTVESGQKNVTLWFEKHGYEAILPEDISRLARIKSVKSGLSIHTLHGKDDYLFDDEEFKRKFPDLSGPGDPAVWDSRNQNKEYYYMNSSFRITLIKRFQPQTSSPDK